MERTPQITTEVSKNTDHSRYELYVDGKLAGVADYRERGDEVVMPHTEIAPALRGRGLGDVLVRGALDDLRDSGKRVVPQCWFVAEFIEHNREYRDLAAA